MKNITTRQAIFWLAIAMPVVIHSLLLYRYSVNAPRLDDFSDGFVFLVNFNAAELLEEKIQRLFSLYQNHRWAMLHTVYAMYGCIDFRSAGFLSMPWLLALLWLFHNAIKDKSYHLPAVLAASLLIFNLHAWTGMFWITASLAAFPSIALALAAFTVATKNHNSWSTTILLIAISLLATFTNGNGTFIWPLLIAYFYISSLTGKKHNPLQILCYATAGIIVLTVFFSDLVFIQDAIRDERLSGAFAKIIGNPALLLQAILATIGSNMIYYSGSADWRVTLAIAIGTAECLLFGWLLLHGALREKPALILLAFYIGATMAAIAVSRAMFLGIDQAFQGHYKLYNSTFLLLLMTAIMDWFSQHKGNHAKKYLSDGIVVALTASMYAASLVLFLPKTDNYNKTLEADTRNWLFSHTLKHAETRLYVPEFNKKLTAAVEAGAYNPWQLLQKTEMPLVTEKVICPTNLQITNADLKSHKQADAVFLMLDTTEKIPTFYLCSPLQAMRITVMEQSYTENKNGTYSLKLWVPRDKNIKEDSGPWQVYPSE